MLTLAVGCQNSSRVSDTSWDDYNFNGRVKYVELTAYEKQYDRHNNVIATVSTSGEEQNYSKRYEYTYDNMNNWIKRISYNSDIKNKVEMRSIDYY